MRHHPQDVAGVVQNASDIPRRPVDRIGIAERDAALALDPVERGGIGEIIAVVVRDRDMVISTATMAAVERAWVFSTVSGAVRETKLSPARSEGGRVGKKWVRTGRFWGSTYT